MEKYVLITGANGGLGREIVNILIDNNYFVFACDINIEAKKFGNLVNITLDVTSDKSIKEAMIIVKKYTNKLDAIINLAGIFSMDSIVEGSESKLRKIIEVNFWGTYKVNKSFMALLEPGYGKIINMSSELGRYSIAPFNGYYSLSKHLVDAYSDVLRRELMFTKISVITLRVGSFKTSLLETAESEYQKLLDNTVNFTKVLNQMKPLMVKELQKNNNPKEFAKKVLKIIKCKRPHQIYEMKKSFKLKLLSSLPVRMQDKIYRSFNK